MIAELLSAQFLQITTELMFPAPTEILETQILVERPASVAWAAALSEMRVPDNCVARAQMGAGQSG